MSKNSTGVHRETLSVCFSSASGIGGPMKRALGALLLGATCIALSPIFVRVSEAGPTATAFWRVALAVPPLWLLHALRRDAAPRACPAKWPLLLAAGVAFAGDLGFWHTDRKSTRLNSSHGYISYAVFCLKKK